MINDIFDYLASLEINSNLIRRESYLFLLHITAIGSIILRFELESGEKKNWLNKPIIMSIKLFVFNWQQALSFVVFAV